HVYQGDLSIPESEKSFTISASTFCGTHSIHDIDVIDHAFIVNHPNWAMEARYLYSESVWINSAHMLTTCGAGMPIPGADTNLPVVTGALIHGDCTALGATTWGYWRTAGKRLLKTTVTRRTHEPSGSTVTNRQYILYRYQVPA